MDEATRESATGMTKGPETASTPENEAQLRHENRRRIVRFVVVFVLTTLALITSYRYAIHTRFNDWYLFQVANHTAMVLDQIGRAQLEPLHYGRFDPQETRASITAWGEGRDEPGEAEIASASAAPLSAWERWSYRALEMRHNREPRTNGPRVHFVLREGISTRIDEALGEINGLETNGLIDPAESKRRVEDLREELQELRVRQQALRDGADSGKADTSMTFPFILIPECGAIEIMAIFLAAVLAFPTLWWKRLIGLAAGLPVMYGVNVFRLTVLAVIGAVDKSRVWFNFAHEYIWQAVYIIFVVAVWLLWVEYIVNRTHIVTKKQTWGLPGFCLRFLVFVVALEILWLLVLPYYGQALLQLAGIPLRHIFGMAIEAGRIETQDILNTGTRLIYVVNGIERTMPLAKLAANVPPYVALVLATAGLLWKRRLRILLYGCAILCVFHVLFIIIVLRFQEALLHVSEVPTAVIIFFLTLPFMLWIVFAYWDRILARNQGKSGEEQGTPVSPAVDEAPPES